MQPKIPPLKSRYVPVHSNAYVISSKIHWWKKTSPFIYPYVLINLLTSNKKEIDLLKQDSQEDLFLLTDSGGFQVLSGTCNITWEESLQKQIELGASKIFSFDKPPTKEKKSGSLSQFVFMTEEEAYKVIEDNLKIGLEQSKYLKEKYPEEFKKFCFIMQAKTVNQIKFNISLFKKYLGGIENFTKYFPGGIVYGLRGNDNLYITIAARHAYENFIKRGIYVHFLGMGSFYRMILLIRNEISTFDSSTILQATRVNEFVNPINTKETLQIPSNDLMFTKQWCCCPVCSKVDYHKLVENGEFTMVGRNFIGHNLWHMLTINVFLDAIPKNRYTEIVTKNFKLNNDIKRCLEFCDMCDKDGFYVAYDKFKHYLKKDETKQNTLF